MANDDKQTPSEDTSKTAENWITPDDLPFVEGEKAKVKIVLTRSATGKGVKAKLKSPAFSSAYDVKFAEGEAEKEIEVTFSKSRESSDHEIVLEPEENCALGTDFCHHVEVYPDRPVCFPSRGVLVPNGPFTKDDEAKITVDLLHPAPDKGAKAKLSGPFDKSPLTLEFERGTLRQTAQLKFSNEDQEDQKITIEKVEGCITGEPKEHAVKIRTPKVEFNKPVLEIPNKKTDSNQAGGGAEENTVSLAGEAILKLKLDTPAPITGSAVRLTSEAFQLKDGYEVTFPRLEDEAAVTVRIKDDTSLVDQTKPVELKTEGIRRCELGDEKSFELKIVDCPRIKFAAPAITGGTPPPQGDVYEQASKATLHIEPTVDPEEDVRVMIKSTAFGGETHIVILKKGPKAKVTREVVLNRGYPADKTGAVPDQKIRIVTPEGWLADPTKTDPNQAEAEPSDSCALVKVKRVVGQNIARCSGGAKELWQKLKEEKTQHDRPEEDEPDLDMPCNLHAVKLKFRRGDTSTKKPIKRGPESKGTFEVVRDKSLAKHPDKALAYSPGRIPVIQVTGGSEVADPLVKSPMTSPHYLTVALELDETDKYCPQQFKFPPPPTPAGQGKPAGKPVAPSPRQHPFIHAHEKVMGPINRKGQGLRKGYDLIAGTQKLPAMLYNKGVAVGDALGLPVGKQVVLSGSNQPPGPLPPPLAQQYIWKPAGQPLRFVREEEYKKAKADTQANQNKAKLTITPGVNPKTIPLFQARQVWLGQVQAGAKIAAPKKAAKKKGAKAAGPMIGAPPPVDPAAVLAADEQALVAQEQANADLLKKNLLAALSCHKMPARRYWLDVEACGIPTTSPADKGGPNRRLQANVDVYPSDEFCLHFEYNPDLPIMKTGAEGALFKPQKGCGEDGLKPVEEKPEEPSETTAEKSTEPVTTKPGWQDEEEPEDSSTNDETKEVETGTTTEEPEPDLQPPTRGDGGDFLSDISYMETEEVAAPKKESEVTFAPTKVWHPYKPPKAGINKSSASMINQVVHGIQQNHVVDFADHVGNTGVDQTAREQGDSARKFLDNNLFKKDCFNISLSRNGMSSPLFLEINKAIGGLIGTLQELTGVFNRFSGNWVPAQGFGIHLQLAFMEGNLNFYWGWKELEDNRVFRWWSLQIFMTLLRLKFSIDFAIRKHILLVKFEMIISGHISLESVIDKGFERVNPDEKLPDWIDKWDSTEAKADIGVRIVLQNENACRVNAALKTGFTFKYRLSVGSERPPGIQYEIHFQGLTLDVAFKVKCLKEKRISVPIIKPKEPEGTPLKAGIFPKKKPVEFRNLRAELAMLMSSVKGKRSAYLDKLTEYQNLQLKMVRDSKQNPDEYPYTEDGFLPGYRYEGEGSGDGDEMWKEQKKKWDEQWQKCHDAFANETKKIRGRNSLRRYKVSERLQTKVAEIKKITDEFITCLKGLDALRLKFLGLEDDIADADVEEEERVAAEKAFREKLKTLAVDTHFKASSNSQMKKLTGLLTDLEFYALKRTQW